MSALRNTIGHRTCAIQISRHVGHVRAEEQPHPKAEKRHYGGDGVEEVGGQEVPRSIIFHFPFGVIIHVISVQILHTFPLKTPVVACFPCGAVRHGLRYKQREQDDAKSGHRRTHEERFLVEGFAPHSEVCRKLEGGGAAGRHGHRHGERCFGRCGGSRREEEGEEGRRYG